MDAIPDFRRDVLVSIRPIYASKILLGQKTVELRRKFTELRATGATAFIYSSSPVRAVVASACIKHVLRLPVTKIWEEHNEAACISKDEFDAYFEGLEFGFAIFFDRVRSMNHFKLLIDTNVVIGLEDFQPVQLSLAELVRLSNQYGVGLFVDGANYDDVARDNNTARRVVTQSKLAKFQRLRGVPVPDDVGLAARFGAAKSENDRSDVRLLAAVDAKAVDFLITQDNGLHKRAEKAGLGLSVLTVEEALQWLKQTFTPISVSLPYVVERKAYELRQ